MPSDLTRGLQSSEGFNENYQVSVETPVRKNSTGGQTGRCRGISGRSRSGCGPGLLPDPPDQLTPPCTSEGAGYSTLPPAVSRQGVISPILSYGRLPVLSPPAPYPGYFLEAPSVVKSDEPSLESKEDFPEISATVPVKRKSFGKFPKKRQIVCRFLR